MALFQELRGDELRTRLREGSDADKAAALVEVERRRDNLRGAVVPTWERAIRGERLDDWTFA